MLVSLVNFFFFLADFGFARYLNGADMATTLCGSPLYMVSGRGLLRGVVTRYASCRLPRFYWVVAMTTRRTSGVLERYFISV